jgi:ribosomal protein L16 Arg81 hydroxylase
MIVGMEAHWTAADLVKPLSLDRFLKAIYSRKAMHFRAAAPERFAALFPWHALNDILRHHRLEPPRIRMSDLNIESSAYVRYVAGPKGQKVPRLLPREMRDQLAAGATLVVDAVDEIQPQVRALCMELERVLHEPIQTNLYVGWQKSQGFGTHWDGHDVFIVQVHGRKHWNVYGASRKYPLSGDSEPESNVPRPPFWEGVLEAGDVLYIPRGWWHDAASVGVPTLHLTFGVQKDTGMDFLNWILGKLREEEKVRQDLPRFALPAARKRHTETIARKVAACLRRHSMDEFFEERETFAPQRADFSLPWSVTPELHPLTHDMAVRTVFSRLPEVLASQKPGVVVFRALGREWNLPETLASLLVGMADGRPHTVQSLCKRLNGDFTHEMIPSILSEFVAQGLLEVTHAENS